MTIIEDRLPRLEGLQLKQGMHESPDVGMCLMEAASWLAGEPFSDHPECVCPVIGAFGRSWNDALDDEDRDRLVKPFVTKVIGTRSTPEVQDARAFMAADWAVRVYTPAWLRLAGLDDDAASLESLTGLSSTELCKAAMPTIAAAQRRAAAAGAAARAAAWAAARAAGDAARAAAWAAGDAARDAAWAAGAAGAAAGAAAWAAAWAAGAAAAAAGDAARAAARAAGAAAGAAARAAAWAAGAAAAAARAAAWAAGDAARDAAWAAGAAAAAAGDALGPVVELLQSSASDLYQRMIDLTPEML